MASTNSKYRVNVIRNSDPAYHPYTVVVTGPKDALVDYSGRDLPTLLRRSANWIAVNEKGTWNQ